jgi:hypothetical protein
MVSISQSSEELPLYNFIQNVTISDPALKAASLHAFPD